MPSLRLEEYIFAQVENQVRLFEVLPEGFAWHIDIKKEMLTFYNPTNQEIALTCPVQLVGSQATEEQTFLWAWANTGSEFPYGVLEQVRKLKALAEQEGKSEPFLISHAFPPPSEKFGMEMSVLCSGVGGGFCPYTCSYDGGALYTVVEMAPRAKNLPADPMRIIRAMTIAMSTLVFDHKEAVAAYLGEPDAEGVYLPSGIKVLFDESQRIAEMAVVLKTPPPKPASPFAALKRLFGP